MDSKDGVPRRAILVITAILVSVILGAQASTRSMTHQIFAPMTPLADLVSHSPAGIGKQPSKRNISRGSNTTASSSVANSPVVKAGISRVYAAQSTIIVHVSGTLSNSTTWSSDKLYYVHDLSIPEGVSLTIKAGTMVRVEGARGFVVDGGLLTTQGTKASPVAISSVNGSYGRAGDYDTAVTLTGGRAVLKGALITDANVGVLAQSGSVSMQDAVLKDIIGYGISACNWDDLQCAVDAGQAEITANTAIACGKVLLNDTVADGALSTTNCDGSVTPLNSTKQSTDQFTQAKLSEDNACASGDMTSCDDAQNRLTCVQGNLAQLRSDAFFIIPDAQDSSDLAQFSNRLSSNAGAYAIQAATDMQSASIAGLLTNIVDTFGRVRDAFAGCMPQ